MVWELSARGRRRTAAGPALSSLRSELCKPGIDEHGHRRTRGRYTGPEGGGRREIVRSGRLMKV